MFPESKLRKTFSFQVNRDSAGSAWGPVVQPPSLSKKSSRM